MGLIRSIISKLDVIEDVVMTFAITNDQQLRQALHNLPLETQRKLGAHFVASVGHLSSNPVVSQGLQVAKNPQRTTAELELAYKSARKLAIDSYTACGRDADWSAQAEHFVAAAITACLLPSEHYSEQENIAWKAAMQARMARNCEMIIQDKGEVDNEASRQYSIAAEILQNH
jgi:hypothetical protein